MIEPLSGNDPSRVTADDTPAQQQPFKPATTRPWTRWWWPGSAVDKKGLTAQLEAFAAAGLGGVEITPIYGAVGEDSRYLSFLSPEYLEALDFALAEATRLGLGLDMATGTGWPFGGPWVSEADASHTLVPGEGRLAAKPTGMQVKRAAPGGEGPVLDPFSKEAISRYLEPFSDAFAHLKKGLPRAQFHDSFEYANASWTPRLAAAFHEMHGYELGEFAAELLGDKPLDADALARLKSDYRATIAQLHLEYLQTWAGWAHSHGSLVRNQSHGAPANLIDLYAAVDIPETETFGSTPFPIPGLRRDPAEVRGDDDLPEPLVMRFASSAAHFEGHPLASSESCTWLRDHWKVSLAMIKPELDRLFLNGINHIFYHGSVFSPGDIPWPGWLFYASTQFQPHNPWWRDFSATNAYVTRVQNVLQSGQPHRQVLLYWPVHDLWNDPQGLLKPLSVHNTAWATDTAFGRIAARLLQQGYSFDYVSDAQLARLAVSDGLLSAPGGLYQTLIVPETARMPLETLQHLARLGQNGATLQFEQWPADVPGMARLDERRIQFKNELSALRELIGPNGTVSLDGPEITPKGVRPDPLAEKGLEVIRRKLSGGHAAFVANLTNRPFDGWAALGFDAETLFLTDPLNGQSGKAAVRPDAAGTAVYLQLDPGQSILLSTEGSTETAWTYRAHAGDPIELHGTWEVTFIEGGPNLPAPRTTNHLHSWTEFGDPEADRFAGTARYSLHFDFNPATADSWILDLGDVRESARVRLNGTDLGTAWSLPMRLSTKHALRPGPNQLQIEVTNLAANRIRDLDRRGLPWKIMRDINFVDIHYRPYDASTSPLQPSGLLGPVSLLPQNDKSFKNQK